MNRTAPELDERTVEAAMDAALAPFDRPPGDLNGLRERLLTLMWDDVGVLRDADGLRRGIAGLEALRGDLMATGIADSGRDFNLTWHDWLNLKSLIDVSEVIAHASLAHEGSRGAHFRTDHTDEGDLTATRFTIARRSDKAIDIALEPVDFSIIRPGQSLIDDPSLQPAAE